MKSVVDYGSFIQFDCLARFGCGLPLSRLMSAVVSFWEKAEVVFERTEYARYLIGTDVMCLSIRTDYRSRREPGFLWDLG